MEGVDSLFHFPTITEDKNTELITNLGVKRAGQSMVISAKLFKDLDIGCLFTKYIFTIINKCKTYT